jgi:hypothetical protein
MKNLKQRLVERLANDQRIRNYNTNPTTENAEKCIKAYQEAIQEFMKEYEEQSKYSLEK